MTTPNTFIRCRMRDLISCFNARKVLTKEEDGEESVHQTPKASANDNDERHENEKQSENETEIQKDGHGVGHESPTSWQSCDSDNEEDEYIVFCFNNDESRENNQKEIQVDSKSKGDERNKSKCKQHEYKDILGDSSDSSTSSFAFPTMQREWTGSPVLMPRAEGQKNCKARNVCVQCCKFKL